MSFDISSLITNTNAPQLNPSWGYMDNPASWGDVSTGLFGNVHGVNAINSRYIGSTMPSVFQDTTAPGNTWAYTMMNTGNMYSNNSLGGANMSDIAVLAGILANGAANNSYNTLGLAGNTDLGLLAGALGISTNPSNYSSPDISTLAGLLGIGNLNVDFTGIDFANFNLDDNDMANLILGLASTVSGQGQMNYSSYGGYTPFASALSPIGLNSNWGSLDNPASWGDVSTGLFGNIHGVNAINSRYIGSTMPSIFNDPTAPGNTWAYTLMNY